METVQYSVVRDLPLEYEDAHAPSGEDPMGFIENWLLAWYDPERRAGGYHHVGLRRSEGLADCWNWVAL